VSIPIGAGTSPAHLPGSREGRIDWIDPIDRIDVVERVGGGVRFFGVKRFGLAGGGQLSYVMRIEC